MVVESAGTRKLDRTKKVDKKLDIAKYREILNNQIQSFKSATTFNFLN